MPFESNTRKVLYEYFEAKQFSQERINANDKPELYRYEEKIGTQLIDMGVEQVIGLVQYLRNYGYQFTTIRAMYGVYNSAVDMYIKQKYADLPYQKKNGFDMLSWKEIITAVSNKEPLLTEVDIDNALKAIDQNEPIYERGVMAKIVMLLHYAGVQKSEQILDIKWEHVDFEKRLIATSYRDIPVSDILYDLLNECKKIHSFVGKKGQTYKMDGYRGCIVKAGSIGVFADKFQDKTKTQAVRDISKLLHIVKKHAKNEKLTAKNLYQFGFYKYMVSKLGKEHAVQILQSVRNKEYIKVFKQLLSEYGCQCPNVTAFKEEINQYIQ